MDSANLYHHVPVSVCGVITQAFAIFGAHWKPFVVLSGFTFVTMFVTFFVLGLITAVAFAGQFSQLSQLIQLINQKITDTNQQSGGGRHLLDYTTRFSGASRLLQYYNNEEEDYDGNYNSDYGRDSYPDSDASSPIGISLIGTMLAVSFLWILAIPLVLILCSGAIVHAVAEVYAGNTPVPRSSIKRGWEKKWTVFGYQIILGSSIFMLIVVTFMLPVFFDIQYVLNLAEGDLESGNFIESVNVIYIRVFKVVMITGLVFFIIMVIIRSLLQAAVPAMIVEHKSATDAFKRSFELCKKYICFIFCTNFCFQFIMFVGIVIVNLILDKLPSFFSVIGHLATNVISTSISPILCFVLYMSMRIREEHISQEEFAHEIGSSVPLANEVELKTLNETYIPVKKDIV